MLRRALGDKRVAFLNFQHGLPRVADQTLRVVRDMGMLQNGLVECLEALQKARDVLPKRLRNKRTRDDMDDTEQKMLWC